MLCAAALLPFLLLHHLSLAASISGLDSFLTLQSTKDPQATNDSFLFLPSSLKKSLSHAFHPATPSSLLSLQLSVPLTVHLVGPTFSDSAPSTLSAFISVALSSDLFHVITTFSSDASIQHLSISHSLHHEVFLSFSSLSNYLSAALDSHLSSAPPTLRSQLSSVPYSIVDSIIKKYFEKERPINSINIYIIHLGSQSKPYAYSYTPGDSSPAITKCLGSIWTGKDRYLWIDLGAGPVDYGPALSGDMNLVGHDVQMVGWRFRERCCLGLSMMHEQDSTKNPFLEGFIMHGRELGTIGSLFKCQMTGRTAPKTRSIRAGAVEYYCPSAPNCGTDF